MGCSGWPSRGARPPAVSSPPPMNSAGSARARNTTVPGSTAQASASGCISCAVRSSVGSTGQRLPGERRTTMAERERPERLPVVYTLPDMDAVANRKDMPYRQLDGEDALADIYRPAGIETDSLLPAVIFVHGDGSPEMGPAKEWGQYQGWGK